MNWYEMELKRLLSRVDEAYRFTMSISNLIDLSGMNESNLDKYVRGVLEAYNQIGTGCHSYAGACLALLHLCGVQAQGVIGVAERGKAPKGGYTGDYSNVPPNHCWVRLPDGTNIDNTHGEFTVIHDVAYYG